MEKPLRRKLLLLAIATVVCFFVIACGSSKTSTVTVTKTVSSSSATAPHRSPTYLGSIAPKGWGQPLLGAVPSPPVGVTGPTHSMFDSVDLSQIPSSPFAVAGYTSGLYPTWPSLTLRFPKAHRVPVVIAAFPVYRSLVGRMACLDVEPYDASPAQSGPWARGELGVGVTPCLYSDLHEMGAVKASLAQWLGPKWRSKVFLWLAYYIGRPGLIAGYDAVQYTDHAVVSGQIRNLDESTVSSSFLGIRPVKPKPKDIGGVQHYERYPQAPRGRRERNTVMTWDRRGCRNPVRRPVCVSTRAHLLYDLGRDQTLYRRDSKQLRDELHLPGRIQGLSHRLNNGHGVVRHWL